MNKPLLETAINVARMIDDSTDRDESLCAIAAVMAAEGNETGAQNCIGQIRIDEIRAEALRKSLDNLLAQPDDKKDSLGIVNGGACLSSWVDNTLNAVELITDEDDKAEQCRSLIMYILPRINKEKSLESLLRVREQVCRMANPTKRTETLLLIAQMFTLRDKREETAKTLELSLQKINLIGKRKKLGMLLGKIAQEYWSLGDYLSAFDCIGRIENRQVQTMAYRNLAEGLALTGKFGDAESIVEQLDDENAKAWGKRIIEIGKNIYQQMPQDSVGIMINVTPMPKDESDSDDDSEDNHNDYFDEEDDDDDDNGGAGMSFFPPQMLFKSSNFDFSDASDKAGSHKDSADMKDGNDLLWINAFKELFSNFNNILRGKSDDLDIPEDPRIEDFTINLEEFGFEKAWQDLIVQGDFKFAVGRALEYYKDTHKGTLFFGLESQISQLPRFEI